MHNPFSVIVSFEIFFFQAEIFREDIIELMIAEHGMDLLHMVLLDIFGMRIGQPEQALGEMSDHGMIVEEFLVVEPLGQEFFPGSGADDGALIGEG